MTPGPDRELLDAELEELGVESTRGTRQLMSLLATEPRLLYQALSRLSEAQEPDEDDIPPVDRLVDAHLRSAYRHCTEPSMLRKGKPISEQCKRLLAVLVRDVGTPVPLAELLLVNGLRSATPRRLRELKTEHGAFRMRTYSRDGVQHYILEDVAPDVEQCARYWIRANLRAADHLPAARRVLALLSAHLGSPVSRRDLDYVLPEDESPGRGLARAAAGVSDSAIGELRERGYAIDASDDEVVLRSLESGCD